MDNNLLTKKILYSEENGHVLSYKYFDLETFLESYAPKDLYNAVLSFFEVYASYEKVGNVESYLALYYKMLYQIIKNYDDIMLNNEAVNSFYNFLNIILNLDISYNKNNMRISIGSMNPLKVIKSYLFEKDLYTNKKSYYYFSIANQRFYYDMNSRFNLTSKVFKCLSKRKGLSRVYSYRLIEKVVNYIRERYQEDIDEIKKNITIKISIFGELYETEILLAYFKLKNVTLIIDQFEEKKDLGKYIFENKNCTSEEYKRINLLDVNDFNKMMDCYDIVLFLDLASFYELVKESEKLTSKAVFNIIKDREIENVQNIVDINYLLYAYKSLVELKNFENYPYSLKYMYDRTLIDFVRSIVLQRNEESHIYFYISNLDEDLEYYHMSNLFFREEIYNNRELMVLRPCNNLCYINCSRDFETNNIENRIFRINIWKLLKNNESKIQEILNEKLFNQEKTIDFLGHSYFYLRFRDVNKIEYNISYNKNLNQTIINICEKEIEQIVRLLRENDDFTLIKFSNALFSQAEDELYVLLAYYLHMFDFSDFKINGNLNWLTDCNSLKLNYKQKTILNMMIEQFENSQFRTSQSKIEFYNQITDQYFGGRIEQKDKLFYGFGNVLKHFNINCKFLYNLKVWEE